MPTKSPQSRWLIGAGIIGLALATSLSANQARAQTVRSRAEAAAVLVLEKLSVRNGAVAGEVYNRSPHLVRDVQLLIRHTWLWNDEFKPGSDDPGISTDYTLPQEIAAGGRLAFDYKPSPPFPKASGGQFETTA